MVGCLFPNSVMILVFPTNKSPVISTLPVIVPPVSSYLLSNAVCNPSVFAMVQSPSSMVGCLVPISVKRLVVPTKKEVPLIVSPVISPVVVKSPCCVISPTILVPTRVKFPCTIGNEA